jgi:hypothetical protein
MQQLEKQTIPHQLKEQCTNTATGMRHRMISAVWKQEAQKAD